MAVCHDYKIPHSQFLSWSQDDRDKAIWSLLRERQACQGCGTRPDEWEGDLDAYKAETQMCHGCRAVSIAREQNKDAPAGVHVTLRRRGDGGQS
jgi:hypothetical protein